MPSASKPAQFPFLPILITAPCFSPPLPLPQFCSHPSLSGSVFLLGLVQSSPTAHHPAASALFRQRQPQPTTLSPACPSLPLFRSFIGSPFFFLFLFLFFNFYCYSITVVCLFSPSLHPTPLSSFLSPNFPPWQQTLMPWCLWSLQHQIASFPTSFPPVPHTKHFAVFQKSLHMFSPIFHLEANSLFVFPN